MAEGTQTALNDFKCVFRASTMSDAEMQFFVDMAQNYIDSRPTLRANSDMPDNDDAVTAALRFIKANIAAHFAHAKDPLETATKTGDSQDTFMNGSSKMIGFHLTPYGRNAISLDKTNTLEQEGAEEFVLRANVTESYGYYGEC